MKNIKPQVVIIEDSSKASLGGGQKITLEVCRILSEYYSLVFVDFTKNSRYFDYICKQYPGSKKIVIKKSFLSREFLNPLLKKTNEILGVLLYHHNVMSLGKALCLENSIVYATTRKSLVHAAMLYRKYSLPYIYHAHLIENNNGFRHQLIRLCLKQAFCIIAVSQAVAKSMNGLQNIQIVYNPKPITRARKKKKNHRFVVAAAGNLIPIKGFEYFIEAAKLCSKKVGFRIYGDGPLLSKLLIKSHGVVKFMGFFSNILEEFYKHVDILVLPSIIPEAQSLVVIEAKSLGIPVIATNIGGNLEIIDDCKDGYLVPTRNAEEIAKKVMALVSNLDHYNEMAFASYKSSKIFSKSVFEKAILKIIQDTFLCKSVQI